MPSMDNGSLGSSSDTNSANNNNGSEDEMDLRRGPWTVEEDLSLINYIASHGEGRWNSLARCAGLKRTGKSCRLRWLNYLRPDVRRGNITLEEQLMILELHSRWGNRWSKIAQYLPGRTDNEIKNYWRTRVQKHAKQLKCDVNSKQFKDTMRYLWMPRLVERIQAAATTTTSSTTTTTVATTATTTNAVDPTIGYSELHPTANVTTSDHFIHAPINNNSNFAPENSANSSDSFNTQVSDVTDFYSLPINNHNVNPDYMQPDQVNFPTANSIISHNCGYLFNGQEGLEYDQTQNHNYNNHNNYYNNMEQWYVGDEGGDTMDNLWNNVEDIYYLQHQFSNM